MRRTNSAPQLSQDIALRDAIAKARGEIERGDVQAAVRNLPRHLTDQHDFHKAILRLLDSSPSSMRPKLIEEALAQHPNFKFDVFNKEGKTVLDVAVQHDDQEFARYLLGKGARPELVSLGTVSPGMQALLTSWRRKNLLYAHCNEGSQPSSQALLDRLLLEGRHEEVRGQLAGMIERHDIRRVWEKAMSANRHDILRALLVVGTPDELRELTKDKYAVGQWIEALHDDPGLSTVLKEFPYQSAKRGKPKYFNGEVKFPGTKEPIVCRHLATYHQVRQANNPKIKFDYHEFSSTETIANNVKKNIENTHKVLVAQASESHLIDNRRFGQFLVSQFEAMEKDGKQNKLMLVTSTNHSMNIGLRIKKNNGKKSFVAKFFDPNETTTVTRSKADRVKTFETQTLSSYITNAEALKSYYPDPVGMSMIFVHPEEGGKSSSTFNPNVGKTLTSMDIEEIDAIVIWHLMTRGFSGSIRQLHDHFSALPQDKQIELLAGKDNYGTPALFMCMQNGHAETITAYGDLLNQCGPIPQNHFINLLSAKYKGTPALFMSMLGGHAEAIKAYGELLKQLESIPQNQLIELLAAKDSSDEPALYTSMYKGHAEAVKAYGELLQQFESIPQSQLIELLAARYKNIPAFFISMQRGHAEAIKAYGELLKQYGSIPQNQIINLLAAKYQNTPALFISMQKGHAHAITAYGELLKQFGSIPQDQLINLLTATTDDDHTPALFMCMQKGHAEAITAYGDLLKQCGSIPQDQLINLLAAKYKNAPALLISMHEGRAEAVKAYGELVKLLPPDKQADLLLAKTSCAPYKQQNGLQIALETRNFKAVNELLQLLTQLAPDLSAGKRSMLQKELQDAEETFGQLTLMNPSFLQEWIKLKDAISALGDELRK